MTSGSIIQTARSANLAANLLEDPSERDLFVYLPLGYEQSGRRYPTACLLHAYGGSAQGLVTPATEGPRWRQPIAGRLRPLRGANICRLSQEPAQYWHRVCASLLFPRSHATAGWLATSRSGRGRWEKEQEATSG